MLMYFLFDNGIVETLWYVLLLLLFNLELPENYGEEKINSDKFLPEIYFNFSHFSAQIKQNKIIKI